MSTITTRSGKGSPLTNNEVDANFTNLNTDKLESADLAGYATLSGATFTGEVEATGFNGDLTGAILFKGQAGEALTKGDPVYISGISGNKTVVSKADANDANKMPCFGIIDATVSANADCSVVTFGTLQGLDTSSFSEGDELFVSDTGTLTTTAPTGESSQLQKIGKVTRSHASTGSIKVMGAGRTNAVPNLNDGQFFLGNGSNQAVSTDFTTSVLGEISAGTGIGISGSGVISNSAPDQTVSLTGGTGISTSGTYPNFTITNDSPDQTVSLTGAGTTTVSGTYPNFTITGAGTTYTAGTGITLTGTEFSLTDTNAKLNLTGGTITSGGNIGLKVSHDDFQEGIISYRNHASNSASYVFENASGRTGTLYTLNDFPMWRDGTTSNSHKVWTQGNDGSGSGLDADTVDGVHASDIMQDFGTTTADLDTLTASGAYRIQNSNANRPANYGQLLTAYGGADTIGQIYFDYQNGNIFTRAGNPSDVGGGGSWSDWRTYLNSNVSDVYEGRVLEFGNAGNGSNTEGCFLSVEGNTDSGGEGSGRLFFREHNSTTTDADKYGVSLGYRGGAASVTTAMGNSWTGLSSIGNGEWGMWGHNGDVSGNLIMHGSRDGASMTIDANLTVDNGTTTKVNVVSDDNGQSEINLYGVGQGTGRVYVGQSLSYGGGIEYNGDNSPATSGATADRITLYRRSAGTNYWTAQNAHSSNDWSFRGNVTAYASDERLKDNVTTIDNALDKVSQLRGVTYDWKDDVEEKGFLPSMKHETGVIAQEVQKVIPDAVVPAPFDNEYLTVQHEKIIPVLIEAIKELKAEVEELKGAK